MVSAEFTVIFKSKKEKQKRDALPLSHPSKLETGERAGPEVIRGEGWESSSPCLPPSATLRRAGSVPHLGRTIEPILLAEPVL